MAGRPRGVADAVILRAAVEVIGRVGPSGLTLALVAEEVGLVPGTLVQRFGSKRGLFLALAEQSAREAQSLRERATREDGSALRELETLVVDSMAPMTTPERFANHLALLCLDLADPRLHEHALAVHEARGLAIEALLTRAVSMGELRADTDVAALTGTVQAILAGTGLSWSLERQGTLPQRLRRELHTVLRPHTHADGTSHSEGS